MKIPVREYYGKHGEFDRIEIEIDSQLDYFCKQIIDFGLCLTVEKIGACMASVCLEDYDRGDYKIELVRRDIFTILETIESIVKNFSVQDYQRWCEEYDNYELQFEE